MSWTPEKEQKLRQLWKKGHSGSEIARMLGDTTRNAVIGKIHRLGLSNRGATSVKDKTTTTTPEFTNKKNLKHSHSQSQIIRGC